MEDNKTIILKELELYKDTLVLDGFHVVRLIDFTEDDEDYWYVMETCKDGIYRTSCVGTFIPLKGFIKNKNYKDLERVWQLNYIKKELKNEKV